MLILHTQNIDFMRSDWKGSELSSLLIINYLFRMDLA